MCKKDGSTNPGTHFSDIWADAQRSRSVLFGSLVLKAWRQLFGSARRNDEPIGNARQYSGARHA